MPKHPLTVFLPAAGLGERLRPVTNHLPKPLLPILGKPIIERILERLTAVAEGTIGINLHWKAELLRAWAGTSRWRDRIAFFPEDPILGTGGALKNAEALLSRGPFIVHNSDILLDIDFSRLIEEHLSSGNTATLVCHRLPALSNVVIDLHGQVLDVENAGASRPDPSHVAEKVAYTGVAIYSPEILAFLPSGVSHATVAWIAASKAGRKVRAMDVPAPPARRKNGVWEGRGFFGAPRGFPPRGGGVWAGRGPAGPGGRGPPLLPREARRPHRRSDGVPPGGPGLRAAHGLHRLPRPPRGARARAVLGRRPEQARPVRGPRRHLALRVPQAAPRRRERRGHLPGCPAEPRDAAHDGHPARARVPAAEDAHLRLRLSQVGDDVFPRPLRHGPAQARDRQPAGHRRRAPPPGPVRGRSAPAHHPPRLPVPEHHDSRRGAPLHRFPGGAHGPAGVRHRLGALGSVLSPRRRRARAAAGLLRRRDEERCLHGLRRSGLHAERDRLPSPAPHAGAGRLRIPHRGQGQDALPQARPRSVEAAQGRSRRGAPGISRARQAGRGALSGRVRSRSACGREEAASRASWA